MISSITNLALLIDLQLFITDINFYNHSLNDTIILETLLSNYGSLIAEAVT